MGFFYFGYLTAHLTAKKPGEKPTVLFITKSEHFSMENLENLEMYLLFVF